MQDRTTLSAIAMRLGDLARVTLVRSSSAASDATRGAASSAGRALSAIAATFWSRGPDPSGFVAQALAQDAPPPTPARYAAADAAYRASGNLRMELLGSTDRIQITV